MASDVEVEVPVLVRIRLILLAADDGLKAATVEEPSEDAPRRRIERMERGCMFCQSEDQTSLRWQKKVDKIIRMQCHQLLLHPRRKSFAGVAVVAVCLSGS